MRRKRWRHRTYWFVTFAFATASVLVSVRYQREVQQARQRVSAGSELADTPCGPIEYALAGNGPPVLVVHGAGGGFDQALDFAEIPLESGFRVIAPSRFGYLRSPLPADASPAAQADTYACLLEYLDLRGVAVVGASAGAPSAMQFALRYPDRTAALVLLNPAAYPTQIEQRSEGAIPKQTSAAPEFLFDAAVKSDFLFWAATRIAPETMASIMLATPPEDIHGASNDEQARAARVLEHLQPVSLRRPGLLNDAAITPCVPRYDLERISAPTLVVGIADDLYRTFEGARYTAEHIPSARFISYPTGGHIWVGRQNEIMSELLGFLEQGDDSWSARPEPSPFSLAPPW
jgi:pimeloyl-ACP methyl ester carboxylesterase